MSKFIINKGFLMLINLKFNIGSPNSHMLKWFNHNNLFNNQEFISRINNILNIFNNLECTRINNLNKFLNISNSKPSKIRIKTSLNLNRYNKLIKFLNKLLFLYNLKEFNNLIKFLNKLSINKINLFIQLNIFNNLT